MAQMDYLLRENGWLEECLSRPDTYLYAAEDGDDLVGFTVLAKSGAAQAEFRIALRADRTGLGLGAGITVETLRIGFEVHGFSKIHLIVRKNNRRGISLYRRIGFTDSGERQKEIAGAPVDFWLMGIDREGFTRLHAREARMPQLPRRALIVIDVQNDYVGGNLPIEYPPVEESLGNIGKAMDAARAALVPVVVVQNVAPEGAPILAKGSHGAELHSTVASRHREHYLLKSLPSAFADTGLEEWLRAREIDTVTIVGYMTHNCDLSTVVQGVHAGFAVELLSDATGSLPYANRAGSASAEEIHRVVMVVMQSRFAAVMSTAEWIDALSTGAPPERGGIFSSNQRARNSKENAD
jgi:nicotinamidase-related amidase